MVVVGGGAGVAFVVFVVLGLIGVMSLGWAFLAAIIAAGAGYMFKRTVS